MFKLKSWIKLLVNPQNITKQINNLIYMTGYGHLYRQQISNKSNDLATMKKRLFLQLLTLKNTFRHSYQYH